MKRHHRILLRVLTPVVVVALGGWIMAGSVRRMLYPVPDTMPGQVEETVPELLAELDDLLRSKAPRVLTNLLPGLTREAILELEKQAGVTLPEDIRALYMWHNGVRLSDIPESSDNEPAGPIPWHVFLPLDEALKRREDLGKSADEGTLLAKAAFEFTAGHRKGWIPLFDDLSGNGYFYDPARRMSRGAIFYAFTDNDSYTFYPSLGNLLYAVAECYEEDAYYWAESEESSGLEVRHEKAAGVLGGYGTVIER